MNRTVIEWCDFTINPVKGLCPVGCSYCYARRMYKRYHWDETVRFEWSVANDLAKIRKPSRIFWGSTMELFGPWVEPEWMRLILEAVKRYPQHTHIFLTKQPQNLPKVFPPNCWVGVSATNAKMADDAGYYLQQVDASVKFLSIEPLLEPMHLFFNNLDWLIIGQQTPISVKTTPKVSWIQDILTAASNAGNIPVFMKDNLMPLLSRDWGAWQPRQEFPRTIKQLGGQRE
jgi:protein gp37